MADVIKIENLYKSFASVKAVQDLSFKVKEGELFAFLGVNGAGKSTTISIMCGMLEKDGGKVMVDGVNVDDDFSIAKKSIGVVFQNSVLDKSLSVKENLIHRASLYGITGEEFNKRLEELEKEFGFKSYINMPVGKLSGGQRRKIDIVRALLHQPKILILDEPTTGLDPQTRTTIWSVVKKLRKEKNITVLLTTHYMEEATDADFVVIIDGGKIVAEGSPHDLKNEYSGDFITVYGIAEEDAKKISPNFEKVTGAYRFSVKNTECATEMIVKNPELFKDYEVTKGNMDAVFLAVTGKKLTGDDK